MQKFISAAAKFHAAKQYDKEFSCLEEAYKINSREAYPHIVKFRNSLTAEAKKGLGLKQNMSLLKNAYKLTAQEYFDDYCIYLEWERPVQNRFYSPRRRCLLPIVKQLQRLADDELDILCVSMPPGVGKSALAIFFITWLGGKHPESGILSGSHNSAFLRGVYDEVLRITTGDEYLWQDVFNKKVVNTNAQDLRIDVDVPQRFSTFQFSSIGAENAGKVRAIQLLYCDDLIGGIEEALSKTRLDKKWTDYSTDLRQRKQGHCKELHIATRWSVQDIIGRLQVNYEGNERAYFLTCPALNEQGESNFDYGGSIGYTKEFYEDIKASMDQLSWNALYMNQPIEREGQLYPEPELRRYYELPLGEPDAILSVCDPAQGGGDDTFMPICYVYGEDHYCVDCVCTDVAGSTTDHMLAMKLVDHGAQSCQFESNAAGGRTADSVETYAKEYSRSKNKRSPHITKKHTQSNKETKIFVNAQWIKDHVLFKDASKIERGSMYERMMRLLTSYSLKGKNAHDDVPDGWAQYALYVDTVNSGEIRLVRRFF